ncbi:hypothetical protein ACLF2M_003927 [Vibrio vulnificus]
MSDKPFYRHQVHEIPPPRKDLTEYRLYSGKCTQCGEAVKAQKPSDIPQGIAGPNLTEVGPNDWTHKLIS